VFDHLGFESGALASPLWWILAVVVAGVYVIYTMRATPLVADTESAEGSPKRRLDRRRASAPRRCG